MVIDSRVYTVRKAARPASLSRKTNSEVAGTALTRELVCPFTKHQNSSAQIALPRPKSGRWEPMVARENELAPADSIKLVVEKLDPKPTLWGHFLAHPAPMPSSSSDDTYSFPIGCPICLEVVVFSCTREQVRGSNLIAVSCSCCKHSWVLSAEEKEHFWRLINTSF